MTLHEILRKQNLSVYRLSKISGVPYTTVNDICSGRAQPEKCSAETIYRIARALDTSVEALLAPYLIRRGSFENFKSAVCHRLRALGDIDFVLEILERGDIRTYYDRKWYPESLYLLAMLDYLCRLNGIPLCGEYDDLRCCKLEKPLYPSGILAVSAAAKNDGFKKAAEQSAIPEFIRFNIVENAVRHVV